MFKYRRFCCHFLFFLMHDSYIQVTKTVSHMPRRKMTISQIKDKSVISTG